MLMGRRGFLIGGASLFVLAGKSFAALPVPATRRLDFSVIRKGSQIGTHVLTFDQADDGLVVNVSVDLVVMFGFIPVFRYKHRATETWKAGRVISIKAETNDDGDKTFVSGILSERGFVVDSTRNAQYIAPPDALPATHWNRRMLDGPMINTQTGKLMRPEIMPLGKSKLPEVADSTFTASHYRLSGDARLDTWYDDKPSWVGLGFEAGDGSKVFYLRK